jgi:hypothetical protein
MSEVTKWFSNFQFSHRSNTGLSGMLKVSENDGGKRKERRERETEREYDNIFKSLQEIFSSFTGNPVMTLG